MREISGARVVHQPRAERDERLRQDESLGLEDGEAGGCQVGCHLRVRRERGGARLGDERRTPDRT